MQTLKQIQPAEATGKVKQLFDGFERTLGLVPNLTKVLANSPAALEAYASFSGALSRAALPAETRELIAIAVANANQCDYCLSAHTQIGKLRGIPAFALEQARRGESDDPKIAAALEFSLKLVRRRGLVSPDDVQALEAAGHNDGEVAEIVAEVALNIFTNYFNNVAQTEIDFPVLHATAN